MNWIEIALASAVPIALGLGLLNRILVTHEGKETKQILRGRGVGWQFIRFCAIATGVPIVGLLALRGIVAGEAAVALISAAIGYAFGKMDTR